MNCSRDPWEMLKKCSGDVCEMLRRYSGDAPDMYVRHYGDAYEKLELELIRSYILSILSSLRVAIGSLLHFWPII